MKVTNTTTVEKAQSLSKYLAQVGCLIDTLTEEIRRVALGSINFD